MSEPRVTAGLPGRVGVIGLGVMGFPIGSRLLGAGWEVVAYSLPPSRIDELVAAGATAANDAASLGSMADVVIVSLPTEQDVRDAVLGESGIARVKTTPRLVIDTSTIDPDASRMIAADLRSFGIGYVDAPVSGGPAAAASGTLSVMVGGSDDDLAAARPVLSTIAGVITHCGEVGAGQVCKACNQLIVMGTLELVAEVLALAERSGLDPRTMREALLAGYASSRILELHGQRMIDRDFVPGGKARFNLKDIGIIAKLGDDAKLKMPGFEASASQLQRLIDAGGGELDNSALITVVEGQQ
ncbi:MAG: NAD(P)-dependent oxidoreductase [Solirubrobacteraceae bacterium]